MKPFFISTFNTLAADKNTVARFILLYPKGNVNLNGKLFTNKGHTMTFFVLHFFFNLHAVI